MTLLGYAGWALAAVFGVGWWISHRGLAGIRRDIADARREIRTRVRK
jgi:hypothetical protein